VNEKLENARLEAEEARREAEEGRREAEATRKEEERQRNEAVKGDGSNGRIRDAVAAKKRETRLPRVKAKERRRRSTLSPEELEGLMGLE
jgi:hypothetical protein